MTLPLFDEKEWNFLMYALDLTPETMKKKNPAAAPTPKPLRNQRKPKCEVEDCTRPKESVMRKFCLTLVCLIANANPLTAQEADSVSLQDATASVSVESMDAPETTNAARMLNTNSDLRNALSNLDILTQLKSELRKVRVDGTTYYVVEGDLLLDEDQLLLYAPKRAAREAAFKANSQAGVQNSSF